MKTKQSIASFALAFGTAAAAMAQSGNGFTYQGYLTYTNTPVSGVYDFRFGVYDAGANQIGTFFTNAATPVPGGYFSATIDPSFIDPTNWLFQGEPLWLDIAVRPAHTSSDFVSLTPRQQITSTPYAFYAPSAGMASSVAPGSITSTALGAGVVNTTNLAIGAVTLAQLGQDVTGAFWQVGGNANLTNNFLGTTDNHPLILIANGQAVLEVDPGANVTVDGCDGNSIPATVTVNNNYNAVSGGAGNSIQGGLGDVIVGGRTNLIQTNTMYCAIGGGLDNTIQAGSVSAWNKGCAIGGGYSNLLKSTSTYSTIAGGSLNQIQGSDSCAIVSGYSNVVRAAGFYSTIVGGRVNQVQGTNWCAFIGGGDSDVIGPNGYDCVIAGGLDNAIQNNSYYDLIGGGYGNSIEPYTTEDTIVGGYSNRVQYGASQAFLGGGVQNLIGTNSNQAVIGGGGSNRIGAYSWNDSIGGGYNNYLGDNTYGSVIGGGDLNTVQVNGAQDVVGGGIWNTIQASTSYATIGGGATNAVWANYATIPGGQRAVATNYAQLAYSSGAFTSAGDSQYSLYVLRNQTTSANPAFLFLDGVSQEISLPTNRACAFTLRVIAVGSASHACFGYHLRGAATGNGNGEDDWLIHYPAQPEAYLNQLGIGILPTVFVNGGILHVKVVGLAGQSIRWTATVETTEIGW